MSLHKETKVGKRVAVHAMSAALWEKGLPATVSRAAVALNRRSRTV